MAYYYIRKVAGFLVTLFLVSILTFAVFQILPGDPALVPGCGRRPHAD